ncbi:TP53-binding protein 1 isoform X3 [Takifugu flavidus]|uniref:TP53-binding protein 1 isoform X3 n=1 Tax=Takifugu flavidus TaxID=433684 RepID=UPI002544B2D0|nr:TP53-binding protein 1 isoform X3 [Takifugu flavidus]
MDPGASELESSLPHSENPCLIVEDSQPDSVALEDDPESSYRALLARRLSSLQPTSRSPVLELISSPPGSKNSQRDSQSESSQEKPDTLNDPNSESQQESQVLNICPPLNKKCAPEDMESTADSTTHCVQAEGGTSQFNFLELSQSQDLGGEVTNCQDQEDNIPPPDSEKHAKLGQNSDSRTSGSQNNKAARAEVSSSSSLDSPVQSAQQVSVQVLLHSQCLQTSEQDQQDCEILSSQQDLFETDKTGAAVDSTVSEPEQEGQPTLTPGQSLRLLHLSGQGTLVQESLSQSSIEFVAPSQNSFTNTPFIVPSSPTGQENENSIDEPMDTSLPPEEKVREKEEPMDTETVSKPQPSASTPVFQNSPCFTLEKTPSVPSQPEFSQNVFVPTQSQEAPSRCDQKPASESQCLDSCPFSLPLQLSVNTESCSTALQNSQHAEEDSQATQIEEPEEPPAVDTSDSVAPHHQQANKTSAVPRLQTNTSSKVSSAEEDKVDSESAEKTCMNVQQVDVKERSSAEVVSCSEMKDSCDVTVKSRVQETSANTPPRSLASQSVIPLTVTVDAMKSSALRGEKPAERLSVESSSQISVPVDGAQKGNDQGVMAECEEEVMEEECTVGGESLGVALALSQSQLLTPEPMEDDSVVVVTDSEQDPEILQNDAALQVTTSTSQPVRGNALISTNGHEPQVPTTKVQMASSRLSQGEGAGPESEGLKDKSLSESSGDISFHFTLPKEGDLIGPATGATPPLITQLKQTVRHSTPIEISPFDEKSDTAGDVSADVAMAASAIVPGDSGENTADKGDGKLSLRMKLVTPVDEVNSDRFSLQKPSLQEEDGAPVKESTVASAVTSPSVFSRVRQVHRQKEEEDEAMSVRGELFASPQRSSQASSLGCNSLPYSQSEVLQQEVLASPQEIQKDPPDPVETSEDGQGPLRPPETAPAKANARQTFDQSNTSSPPIKLRHRTNFSAPGLRSPAARSEAESPSSRRIPGPSHHRHVRTIKEVRTTITRIITDVYYEDGKEVERKVSEESEDPVVDCQVLDSDMSPCRTGSSSLTSGDLGDISSLSSKASSLQHSSGGTSSSTGLTRPDFIRPSSRGAKSSSRGGGHSLQRVSAQLPSSSDDELYTRVLPPQSPADTEPQGQSDSLRSAEEEEEEEEEVGSPPGSSFVGLRVVAKWSSNGYFYSGRIMKDAGEGRFRLRFDDGYECEVAGKDILLCDPIPLETEVTALLEDEYFSIGVVRGHKTEGQELFYSVEKDGQRQWYNRKAVILSLEQGNKLREQHSLGPYEPSTPLAKASDISLDNLVEGKRRRRGASENIPNRSSSSSPRTPGPSGKRKLMTSEGCRTPAKRGRRGARAAQQRVGICNTSGSGTDLPDQSSDVVETHGPLPQNASLFMGFAFMMTASCESDRLSNKLSSDEDEEYVQTGPYNKTYTESQLQAGGGFILPDFNEEQCKAAYQSLLIADQHCRTQKYLLCLASGVPCVSHLWVRDCCKDNKLLNYRNYLLPAGIGPDDAIVEWHPRSTPFKALRILLVFEKPAELWAQLITMGGASSVRHFQPDASDIPAGKFDVVVTDHTCSPLVEKNMASQEVPLVSPEWLIQSVICGECLGFHSLPRYRHNYAS